MTETILAHSVAEGPSPLPLILMATGLLIPMLALTVYVFWPPRRRALPHENATPPVTTSMYEELWEFMDAVEHNRYTRADLREEERNAMASRLERG